MKLSQFSTDILNQRPIYLIKKEGNDLGLKKILKTEIIVFWNSILQSKTDLMDANDAIIRSGTS